MTCTGIYSSQYLKVELGQWNFKIGSSVILDFDQGLGEQRLGFRNRFTEIFENLSSDSVSHFVSAESV